MCGVTHWTEVGVAKMLASILPPIDGYNFQGRMLDLNRDLSAVQSQKDALVR